MSRVTVRVDPKITHDHDEVERLIRWSVRDDMSDIKNGLLVEAFRTCSDLCHGVAYPRGRDRVTTAMPPSAIHLIRIGIPNHLDYPRWEYGSPRRHGQFGKGTAPTGIDPGVWPLRTILDWQEGLVAITAHEIRHVWQFNQPRSRKPKRPEVDCEWAANRTLVRYRQEVFAHA